MGLSSLTFGKREPMATQLLFQHSNTGGGVALVAIVYGTEGRQVQREATLGTGATSVPTGQVSKLGAISGIVALGHSWNRKQNAGKNQREPSNHDLSYGR